MQMSQYAPVLRLPCTSFFLGHHIKRSLPGTSEGVRAHVSAYYYCCYYYCYFIIIGLLHAFPAKRQGAPCRQAAEKKGCHNPTPRWTHQIQARPNQPWARCSVLIPAPASRGHCLFKTVLLEYFPARGCSTQTRRPRSRRMFRHRREAMHAHINFIIGRLAHKPCTVLCSKRTCCF